MKHTAVLYIHGKNGSASESEHYKPLFPECEVIGFDYQTFSPWETGAEIIQMKTAIVYYSMSGNTAYVADRLKEQLDSEVDLIEIKPVKAFPDSGFKKFLWGGKSAVMAQKPKLQPYTFDAEKYDQIIIGFPVWASRIAPPIRTFVEDNKSVLRKKSISAFACQAGSGGEKALSGLKNLLSIEKMVCFTISTTSATAIWKNGTLTTGASNTGRERLNLKRN